MRILYTLILQLNPPIGSPLVITSEEKVQKQIGIVFFLLAFVVGFCCSIVILLFVLRAFRGSRDC